MILLTSPIEIKIPIIKYKIAYNQNCYNFITIKTKYSNASLINNNVQKIKKVFIIENNNHIAVFKFDRYTRLNIEKIMIGDYVTAHMYFESMYYISDQSKKNEIQLKLL